MEMLMLLFYAGAVFFYGMTGYLLIRMGLPGLVCRLMKKGGRRTAVLFGRIRRKTGRSMLRTGMLFFLLAVSAAVGGPACETRAESFPEEQTGSFPERAEEASASVEIRMEGADEDEGEGCFLREDNCGAAVIFRISGGRGDLTWSCLVDDIVIRSGKLVPGEGGTDCAYTELFSAEETAAGLPDGPHEISAYIYEDGCVLKEVHERFILDTTPPVCSFRIEPGLPGIMVGGAGGRWLFRSGFRAVFDVTDENYDPETTALRRDYASGTADPSEAEADCEGEPVFSEDGHFEDVVTEDGVYRYSLFGSDLAGNGIMLSPDRWLEDGRTSRLLAVDTVKPEGSLTVAGGETVYYEENEQGAFAVSGEYPSDETLTVTISARDRGGGPVRITGWLTVNGKRSFIDSEEESGDADNEIQTVLPRGAVFSVQDILLEDAAGNTARLPDVPEMKPSGRKTAQAGSDEEEREEEEEKTEIEETAEEETADTETGPEESVRDAAVSAAEKVKEPAAPDSEREMPADSVPELSCFFTDRREGNHSFFRQARRAVILARADTFDRDRIVIEAENGEESEWIRKKDVFRKYIDFRRDGFCSLHVWTEDSPGNHFPPDEGAGFTEFVIHRKKPVVRITGAAGGTANTEVPRLTVSVRDPYADLCRVKIRVSSGKNGPCSVQWEQQNGQGEVRYTAVMPEEDDCYTVQCQAVSPSGTAGTAGLSYSLNRKGTVFEFRQRAVRGQRIRTVLRPEIILHDINDVTVLSASVNGQAWDITREGASVFFENMPEADGKYVLTMTVRDSAGHIASMQPVEYWLDRTPPEPVFEVSGDTAEEVQAWVLRESPDDSLLELTIDGQAVPADREAEEGWMVSVSGPGTHTLAAKLADAAGNRGHLKSCVIEVKGRDGNNPGRAAAVAGTVAAGAALGVFIYRKKY